LHAPHLSDDPCKSGKATQGENTNTGSTMATLFRTRYTSREPMFGGKDHEVFVFTHRLNINWRPYCNARASWVEEATRRCTDNALHVANMFKGVGWPGFIAHMENEFLSKLARRCLRMTMGFPNYLDHLSLRDAITQLRYDYRAIGEG
ncbi:hypothetical protein H4R35_006397, partial [Dimargaris xerosporica]